MSQKYRCQPSFYLFLMNYDIRDVNWTVKSRFDTLSALIGFKVIKLWLGKRSLGQYSFCDPKWATKHMPGAAVYLFVTFYDIRDVNWTVQSRFDTLSALIGFKVINLWLGKRSLGQYSFCDPKCHKNTGVNPPFICFWWTRISGTSIGLWRVDLIP